MKSPSFHRLGSVDKTGKERNEFWHVSGAGQSIAVNIRVGIRKKECDGVEPSGIPVLIYME